MDYFSKEERKTLTALQKADHYHFTIPFVYIKKNYGNDQYDDGLAYMEVDVDWDEEELGYRITYYSPQEKLIDPTEGNGDIDEFYDYAVEAKVLSILDSMGITARARVGGTGVEFW